MTVRLPSISSLPGVPLDGFAICNSRGRRVSLLNDDDQKLTFPSYNTQTYPQHFTSSPPRLTDYDTTDLSYTQFNYSNPSPLTSSPSIPAASPLLPPVNDLIFTVPNYDLQSISRKSSISSASNSSRRGSIASSNRSRSRRSSAQSNTSSQTSKRRYECTTCRKTFTTSGHVARHNRIHTGEKNFQCPEPGCSQRFSRQDNCMYVRKQGFRADVDYRQHYRTHKSHALTEEPRSPEWIGNKRRRTKVESDELEVDPNDRLSALASYISAYA
jgi:hypothetical protein